MFKRLIREWDTLFQGCLIFYLTRCVTYDIMEKKVCYTNGGKCIMENKQKLKDRLDEMLFFNRLDIRIYAISAFLEFNEKHLVATSGCSRDEVDRLVKNIEHGHKFVIEQIQKVEREIFEQ